MFIAMLEENEKHSAWDTFEEAQHQVEVLRENGYYQHIMDFHSADFVEQDDTVSCENGHYYI